MFKIRKIEHSKHEFVPFDFDSSGRHIETKQSHDAFRFLPPRFEDGGTATFLEKR